MAAGIKEFRFFSDNANSQNKNHAVAALYVLAATIFDIKIVHRYLEKGHSYNAADNVHSLIERKTRRLDIYTTSQWIKWIRKAKRSKTNPIIVIEVTQDIIFDFKQLAEKMNFDKDSDEKAILWK